MRISHKYKYMYFAKPKSASSTIRNLLNDHCDLQHVNFMDIYGENNPINPFYAHIPPFEAQECFSKKNWNFNEYSLFTTIRNPFTRVVSAYNHFTRVEGDIRVWDFDKFVNEFIVKNKLEYHSKSKWLYHSVHDHFHFIKGLNKNINIKTFKIEDGMEPIIDYLNGLGVPLTLEDVIIRNHKGVDGDAYKSFYSDKSYDIVKENYKKEIEYFNYKF